MSLCSDKFIFQALTSSHDIMEATSGRIFNPGREEEDENEDKIPYIVISMEGVKNLDYSKDGCESCYDEETVNVLVVSKDRSSLAQLATAVRKSIKGLYLDPGTHNWGFDVIQYSMSASAVSLDPFKPCVYQTLTYILETQNT